MAGKLPFKEFKALPNLLDEQLAEADLWTLSNVGFCVMLLKRLNFTDLSKDGYYRGWTIPLTQQQWADTMNVSRHTVQEKFKSLLDAKFIALNNFCV